MEPFDVTLLALASIKGLGRKSLRALIGLTRGDLGTIWQRTFDEVHTALVAARMPSAEQAARAFDHERSELLQRGRTQLAEYTEKGVRILGPQEVPSALLRIQSPPDWLFVQGDARALERPPFVAVVGTREPTPMGVSATARIAKLLSAYPITLVSGLAEGIDAEAHRVSLMEGVTNVAFLGHGLKQVFPTATGHLREMIVDRGGAVVTEYLPDEHFQKQYFVERNRLQAGLADVVVPVEARAAGGTAHTVRFARQFGRRLVGVRWPGANGILADLERDGYPVIDVLTIDGSRRFDCIFRKLAQSLGHETYGLAVAERRVLAESRLRNVRREDVARLISAINAAFPE